MTARIFISLVLFAALAAPSILFAATTGTLTPTADGSNDSADWSSNASGACNGANCSADVDDTSGGECTNADGDSSYIKSSTEGANQTFDVSLSGITDNSTITQIDITACQKRGGSPPPNEFQLRYCAGGSCANSGTNIGAGGSYVENSHSFTGLSVSKDGNTDIEIGVTISGNRNKEVRITKLSAIITYTPPQCDDGIDNDGDGETDYPADDGCTSASDTDETDPAPSGGGDDGDSGSESSDSGSGGGVPPSQVTFIGQAYPKSSIEVLRKSPIDEVYRNVPSTANFVETDGRFYTTYTGLLGADYLFAIRAIDADKRTTGVLVFTANLISDNLIAENLIIPPTFDFSKRVVPRSEAILIRGYAAPKSVVQLEVNGTTTATTTAQTSGAYEFSLDSGGLPVGTHTARVKERLPDGRESAWSIANTFRVSSLENPRADFNGDNKVNIIDWSVFLSRFGADDESERVKADLNDDGTVDIADFSIFLRAMVN